MTGRLVIVFLFRHMAFERYYYFEFEFERVWLFVSFVFQVVKLLYLKPLKRFSHSGKPGKCQ